MGNAVCVMVPEAAMEGETVGDKRAVAELEAVSVTLPEAVFQAVAVPELVPDTRPKAERAPDPLGVGQPVGVFEAAGAARDSVTVRDPVFDAEVEPVFVGEEVPMRESVCIFQKEGGPVVKLLLLAP